MKIFFSKETESRKFSHLIPTQKEVYFYSTYILLSNSYNWTYSNWFAALDLPLHSVLLPCNNINAVTSVWPAFSWIQLPVAPQLRHTGLCGVPHIMTGKAVKQFHQPSAKLPPSSPSSAHAPRAPFRFVGVCGTCAKILFDLTLSTATPYLSFSPISPSLSHSCDLLRTSCCPSAAFCRDNRLIKRAAVQFTRPRIQFNFVFQFQFCLQFLFQ